MEKIQQKFLEFIVRNFMIDIEEIPLDQSLIDEGIIDSFGLIEIAAYIEKEYAVSVADNEMIRENFGSVLRIVEFIDRKLI